MTKRGYYIDYNTNLSQKEKLKLILPYFMILNNIAKIKDCDFIELLNSDEYPLLESDFQLGFNLLNFDKTEIYYKLFTNLFIANLEKSIPNLDKTAILEKEEFYNLVYYFWGNIFKHIFICIFGKSTRNDLVLSVKNFNAKNINVMDGLLLDSFVAKLQYSISSYVSLEDELHYYFVPDYLEQISLKDRYNLLFIAFILILDTVDSDKYLAIFFDWLQIDEIDFELIGLHLYYLFKCFVDVKMARDPSISYTNKFIDAKSFINQDTIKMKFGEFMDYLVVTAQSIERNKENG